MFSVGDAPADSAPIETHELYQTQKVKKLHKFESYLKKWDKEKEIFDKWNLGRLEQTESDPDIIKLFELWKEQRKLTIDAIKVSGENDGLMSEGWLIFNAGCTTTSDGSGLPVNISNTETILKMISEAGRVINQQIDQSGLPAGVCLARSSLDGYCPPDQVDFIQEEVLKLLTTIFQLRNASLLVSKPYLTV